MTDYIVTLDETQGAKIARQAADRGYNSVADYFIALAEADVLIAQLESDWHDADESPDVLEANFREGWHDAMTGNIHPVTNLSDMLKDDE